MADMESPVKKSGPGFYNCDKCHWSGNELNYSRLGQGLCPKCNQIFKGCFREDIFNKLIGNNQLEQRKDPLDLFNALKKIRETMGDKEERQEEVAIAVAKYLPSLQPYHRTHFARRIAGICCDATTASLGYFSFNLLLRGATKEEKQLLEMISELIK